MKKTIIVILFSISFLLSTVTVLWMMPFYYYNQIIENNHSSPWYSVTSNYVNYLAPDQSALEIVEDRVGSPSLWRSFQFGNIVIPQPYKNPFFYASPIFQYDNRSKETNFGIRLYGFKGRDVSKIHFDKEKIFFYQLGKQKLFKIPIIREYLKSLPLEFIWSEVISKDLRQWRFSITEIVRNLFVLQMRMTYFDNKQISFSSYKNDTLIVQLKSENLDYKYEKISKVYGDKIYSIKLTTELSNDDSINLREKIINEISYQEGSTSLSDILYEEFRQLRYVDQVEHTGMLYLLSAWSQDKSRIDFLELIVQKLEYGKRNQAQLDSVYSYLYKRYGKTYAKKNVQGLDLDGDVDLNRKIELEKIQKSKNIAKPKSFVVDPVLTDDQKIDNMLDNLKNKENKSRSIRID